MSIYIKKDKQGYVTVYRRNGCGFRSYVRRIGKNYYWRNGFKEAARFFNAAQAAKAAESARN